MGCAYLNKRIFQTMNINLSRFVEEEAAIVPIVDNYGRHNRRKIEIKTEDGWYKLKLGNQVHIERKATQLEIRKALEKFKKYTGYPLGTEVIPENFDIFFKGGHQDKIEVHFLNVPLFQEVSFVKFEDDRFYFYETKTSNKQRVIQKIREAFGRKEKLSELREVTPELRYYFLLCCLRNELMESLDELRNFRFSKKLEADWNKFLKKNFSVRIKEVIEQANGTFVRYEEQGSNFLVVWKSGGQIVKSIINKELRILNAGFCLSGHDKEHSMNSIINLAKLYQEDMPLHITRE